MTEQIIIKESNFEKARKLIRESKDKKVIFSSDDDELNRKILERQKAEPLASSSKLGQTKEKIDVLLINLTGRKDFQKQRNSGFNQVLAKLAKKNNITIGINFDEVVDSNSIEKQKILSRIQQNIKLCNKNKLKMKFIIQAQKNQRDIYDLKSLGLVLGMGTQIVKEI